MFSFLLREESPDPPITGLLGFSRYRLRTDKDCDAVALDDQKQSMIRNSSAEYAAIAVKVAANHREDRFPQNVIFS
jgi:hypothetical protein